MVKPQDQESLGSSTNDADEDDERAELRSFDINLQNEEEEGI